MNRKGHLLAVISICIACIFFFTGPLNVYGANEEIAIDTDAPGKILIDVKNLKPGDWIPRDITIFNNGERAFKYTTSAENKSTSKTLFKVLRLQIQKGNDTLYKGSLKNFDKLPPRFLASGSSEKLSFRVDVPSELDNIYQNTDAGIDFVFTAEATEDSDSGSGNPGDVGNGSDKPDDEGNGGGNPGDGGNGGDHPGDEGNGSDNPGDGKNGDSNPEEEGNSGNQSGDGASPSDGGTKSPSTNTEVDSETRNHTTQTAKQTNGTLPDTATNMYNMLIGGFVLIVVGGIILVIQQRKLINRNR